MPKANSNDTVPDDLIAPAQQADFRLWSEALSIGDPFNTARRRLFTWGVPIDWQPQRQPEKRVEMGGPGNYVNG